MRFLDGDYGVLINIESIEAVYINQVRHFEVIVVLRSGKEIKLREYMLYMDALDFVQYVKSLTASRNRI